jgi:hypothetical protein
MKPGSGDKKLSILISGEDLDELKGITWALSECYGLDRRIEAYAGKRPIGLYSWDVEALMAAIENVMDPKYADPDMTPSGRIILANLLGRLKSLL